MRQCGLELRSIELALPPADDDGGDAVTDEVGERPAFAHELVDAEQDRERLDRDVGHDRERRRERHEACPGHARSAFDVIMAIARMPSSWPSVSGVLVACARNSVDSVM